MIMVVIMGMIVVMVIGVIMVMIMVVVMVVVVVGDVPGAHVQVQYFGQMQIHGAHVEGGTSIGILKHYSDLQLNWPIGLLNQKQNYY
jgi:hypothetical protein